MNTPSTYFWRDQNGRLEVDCIIDRGDTLFPVEIKSGETISSGFFATLGEWNKISGTNPELATLIYGGSQNQSRSNGKVLSWIHATQFISDLYKTS